MHARVRHLLVGCSTAAVVISAPAHAQTEQDAKNFSAAIALSVTTPAGLPPLLTRSMVGGPAATGPQLALRYGHVKFPGDASEDVATNNIALSGLFSLGAAATFHATIGQFRPDCDEDDCDGEWMFGAGGDIALGGRSFGTQTGAPRLTVSLGGDVGYTNDNESGSALGLSANLPVALVVGSSTSTWKFVPFLTPAFGYGRLEDKNEDETLSAARFILGGGFGIMSPSELVGVSVGFQRVFFKFDEGGVDVSSKTLFGLTVTLGR